MEQNDLRILIDRYFAAESSTDEEREIRRQFAESTALPPDLEQFRNWFEGMAATELSEDFDQKVLQAIDLKTLNLEDFKSLRKKARKTMLRWFSAAACVAVIVFAGWQLLAPREKFSEEMTETEAAEALATVREMLYFTSAEMNRAESAALSQLKTVNIMNEVVTIK
jgi:hypothetical protein